MGEVTSFKRRKTLGLLLIKQRALSAASERALRKKAERSESLKKAQSQAFLAQQNLESQAAQSRKFTSSSALPLSLQKTGFSYQRKLSQLRRRMEIERERLEAQLLYSRKELRELASRHQEILNRQHLLESKKWHADRVVYSAKEVIEAEELIALRAMEIWGRASCE